MKIGSVKTERGDWLLDASTLKGQIILIGTHKFRSHSFIQIFYTENQAKSYIAKLSTSNV